MADRIYRTKQGDMLDWICWHHYGKSPGYVEKVLEYNRDPRLSDQRSELPPGIIVLLPDITPEPVQTTIKLWD